MPRRRRGLSEADTALWTSYTRQVAPLAGRSPVPAPAPAAPPAAPEPPPHAPALRTPPPRPAAQPPKAAALAVGSPPGGIDRGTWNRLRTGRLPVARTLDLHGMTAQRAYHALIAFLRSAHADQARCVEVVTGRGSGEHGGVIRRELPFWLNQPDVRPLILAATHPHAANPGAVRLILRRIR